MSLDITMCVCCINISLDIILFIHTYICIYIYISLIYSVDELNGTATINTEYKAHQKCLDFNDYRYFDCRDTEKKLLDAFNQKMGYGIYDKN
jgi:hypothetical protein